MIVIRTKHDWLTEYLYNYTEILISFAEERGFKVQKIEGLDIKFKHIEKRIRETKPRCIVFNGHGTTTSLCDNSKNEFINLDNAHVFKEIIAFVRACNALKELGPKAVKEGCTAFIGYKNRFWLAKKQGMESRPLSDPIAKPIIDASNVVVIGLLKGHSVEESVNKSHQLTENLFIDLLFSNDPYARVSLKPLLQNNQSLGFEGNPLAKIK